MKVLFDFDLHNNPGIDSHLIDTLLSIKRALIREMQPYKDEIENDKGEFVITMIPGLFHISYACFHPDKSNPKIKEIINAYDWPSEIENYSKGELN